MRYRLLGKTGLRVSELCLGTMTFGGWETIGGLRQHEANALVARALDAGVNLLDNADGYSGGDAEQMLGHALGARRKDVLIASKVRLQVGDGPNDVGLSRSHILDAVDASLRRLGTDYLDLYQIHLPDTLTAWEQTLRALEDLVRWGKVRYIGACNIYAWQLMKALAIAEAHAWTPFSVLQAHYSLAERGLERELVGLVRDQSLGLMVWSPLSGGFLTGKFTRENAGPAGTRRASFDFPPVNRERVFDILDVLGEIAAAHDVPVARVALSWLLHQDVVTSVIIGAKRVDQLDDNLRASDVRLSPDELRRLDEVSALPLEYPGWMLTWGWDDRL